MCNPVLDKWRDYMYVCVCVLVHQPLAFLISLTRCKLPSTRAAVRPLSFYTLIYSVLM